MLRVKKQKENVNKYIYFFLHDPVIGEWSSRTEQERFKLALLQHISRRI